MTDIVTKVSIWGQVVPIWWGSTEWAEHAFITQADYDNLTPAQKAEKVYMITGEGETPTPGGGTATTNGDILLTTIKCASACENRFFHDETWSSDYVVDNLANNLSQLHAYNTFSNAYIDGDWHYAYYIADYNIYKQNILDGTYETYDPEWSPTFKMKPNLWYIWKYGNTYGQCDKDLVVSAATQQEYDSIPSGLFYNGLYYSQSGLDYVVVDPEWIEVKRYVWVWTVDWIANWKLYRNVGDVAYAIATI